ncbi:ABC transporter substrate-binding protein, partial [Klebsiella pneumoniae]
PQAAARGGGFMAGALQTAAGVAGGVVLGNMLTNMFSGSHPQEIVNIIEEKPQPDAASAQDSIAQDTTAGDDPFRQGDDQFLADNTWNDDFDAGFGDDDFGSDDDSWV